MSTTVIHTIEHDIGIDGVLEIRLGDSDVRLRGIDGTTVRVSGDPGDDLEGLLAIDRGAGSLSIRPDRRGDIRRGVARGTDPGPRDRRAARRDPGRRLVERRHHRRVVQPASSATAARPATSGSAA